jgi:hypothetical protein
VRNIDKGTSHRYKINTGKHRGARVNFENRSAVILNGAAITRLEIIAGWSTENIRKPREKRP